MAKPEEKKPAQIFHFDLYGKREDKYDFLNENSVSSINWTELHPQAPDLFFIPQNLEIQTCYNEGIYLKDLFLKSSVGVQTHRDELVIDFSKSDLIKRLEELFNVDNLKSFAIKYKVKESSSWSLDKAIKKDNSLKNELFRKITYRPFDERNIYYSDNFVDRTRKNIGKEIVSDNLVFNFPKIVKVNWGHSLITKSIPTAISMDINGTYFAPLYLYPDEKSKDLFETGQERTPNLNVEIVNKIAKGLGIPTMLPNGEAPFGGLGALDILDYIYAVLHSPTYREKYKEFLKIDFPRVPFPGPLTPKGGIKETQERFWKLVKLGTQIRQIHLLESPIVEKYITQYPEDGDNVVGKIFFEKTSETLGKVYINYDKTPPSGAGGLQYFDNVPEVAWNFYIGGYQPAQKWLKDRKDRELSYEDILHYQKIIVALSETDRIMREIDEIEI